MPTTTTPQKKTKKGRFGPYGGRYVPETLMAALQELEAAYAEARKDKAFQHEFQRLLHEYAGRPTPLFHAERLTEKLGGAKIYLKREDLLHTGAHKINNCIGQALLARRMGKNRIIAETGAGQHGVATATVCALFGLECVVYMGAEDMRRQELNVFRMRLLGAEVRSVDSGSRTLKDAINEAMRDWVTNVRTTHYLLGSVLGAHPYPTMVRDFQRVIGEEARKQILKAEGKLPDRHHRLRRRRLERHRHLPRVPQRRRRRRSSASKPEAAATPSASTPRAFQGGGSPGVLQGTYSYFLQDSDGQSRPHALRLRRTRLPRHRTRARLAARSRPRRIRLRRRQGSARRLPPARPSRRNHPRARIRPRRRRVHQARAQDEPSPTS